MAQDKELLLKDLCARLPYNPLISINGERYRMEEIRNALIGINAYKITVDGCDIEYMNIKPYLFPLSSMTVEQMCKVQNLLPDNCDISFKNQKITFYNEGNIQLEQLEKIFNFFNLFHFDYRGLIEKSLAIDATGLNIY